MSSSRRFTVLVAILAVGVAVTSCTSMSQDAAPALKSIAVGPNGSIPAYESAAVASLTTQQNLREFLPCAVGKRTITVGETYPEKDTAELSVTLTSHLTGQGAGAPGPKSGEYEVASIQITGRAGSYAYSPSQFAFITPKGELVRSTDGNSPAAGFEPPLGSGSVTKGQLVVGTLTFDVPRGGGGLVFSDVIFPDGNKDLLGGRCTWVIGT
ncbi:MAG TPA: hypothetical protein VGD55_14540 [Acidothermaceae bacterium]